MGFLKEKFSARFFLFMAFAFMLVQLPIVGDYFRIINTLIHESGHAFVALLGGNIETISLFMNSDGVTYGTESTWIINLLTSAAGYILSSFIAFLSFWLIKRKKYTIFIDILLGFIIINLILWVRNPYGLFWLLSFGLIFLSFLIKGSKNLIKNLCQLIASVLLIESVSTAYDILVISFLQPHSAGDAANLSKLTIFLPPQVWGMFFLLQALFFCFLSYKKGLFKFSEIEIETRFQMESTERW
ncbi:M50 family metallopeptidase [Bacillus sp. MRMR6]|uniref:M50 family metallopeptidase n=1 Tax=Bacillus sp. MRMR6 TaxID=1928617 RepID=UPI000952B605|nr:M50 family metallopeptidase [Bacillus sp. MRMR6]OLS39891.1 hypothetical protein BTR25_11785 [Bacillus sp. MRMR6]